MMRWKFPVFAAAMLALASGAASADPVADFYKGKQINWILSAGAGGGYSAYALAFHTLLGAKGVWIGLSLGTLVYATLLIWRFRRLASGLGSGLARTPV